MMVIFYCLVHPLSFERIEYQVTVFDGGKLAPTDLLKGPIILG